MHAPDRFGPRRGRYPFQGSRRDGNLQEQSIRTTLPGRAHRIYSSAREHRPHAVRRTILPRTNATAARPHSVTPGRFPRPSGDVTASARRFLFGEAHLRQILSAYASYYNEIRTQRWARTRPWVGRSSGPVPLSPSRFCPDYTTITSGCDFRKAQVFGTHRPRGRAAEQRDELAAPRR